jgi:hypothetical protein
MRNIYQADILIIYCHLYYIKNSDSLLFSSKFLDLSIPETPSISFQEERDIQNYLLFATPLITYRYYNERNFL